MDVENSPTVVVGYEVEVSREAGIDWKTRLAESPAPESAGS